MFILNDLLNKIVYIVHYKKQNYKFHYFKRNFNLLNFTYYFLILNKNKIQRKIRIKINKLNILYLSNPSL